jgi:hypothetical protein
MSTRAERTLTGAFRATHLAADAWRLNTSVAGAAEIYLSGVDKDAFATLRHAEPRAVTLAWSAAGADVTLILAGARAHFRSRSATIHEPRPLIYQGLPLVVLDKAAKRFWRRVFFIARMPGGRRVLGWIAQRRRG